MTSPSAGGLQSGGQFGFGGHRNRHGLDRRCDDEQPAPDRDDARRAAAQCRCMRRRRVGDASSQASQYRPKSNRFAVVVVIEPPASRRVAFIKSVTAECPRPTSTLGARPCTQSACTCPPIGIAVIGVSTARTGFLIRPFPTSHGGTAGSLSRASPSPAKCLRVPSRPLCLHRCRQRRDQENIAADSQRRTIIRRCTSLQIAQVERIPHGAPTNRRRSSSVSRRVAGRSSASSAVARARSSPRSAIRPSPTWSAATRPAPKRSSRSSNKRCSSC